MKFHMQFFFLLNHLKRENLDAIWGICSGENSDLSVGFRYGFRLKKADGSYSGGDLQYRELE